MLFLILLIILLILFAGGGWYGGSTTWGRPCYRSSGLSISAIILIILIVGLLFGWF
jgi:hypothetical protein